MSALLDELRSKWQEALASGRGHREWRAIALSIASPVKLLAGIRDRDDRSSILLETPLQNAPKHRVRFQAEGISLVDERWADEGLLRLAVTLERADLRQIYEVLAFDSAVGRGSLTVSRNRSQRDYTTARSLAGLPARTPSGADQRGANRAARGASAHGVCCSPHRMGQLDFVLVRTNPRNTRF